MGARQKAWAKGARCRLVTALGGQCVACCSRDNLTFDCRKATGCSHHPWDSSQRMSYYRQQARMGNVQLLCGYCNSMKAGINPSEWEYALQHVRASASIQLLSSSPGQGTALTPAELRECLAVAVRKIYATREQTARIKAAFRLGPQPVV